MIGSRRIRKYMKKNFSEVLHTTMNPEGPGSVRVHLIPPAADGDIRSSIAIINGQDIIPVNYSWAIVLAEFIKHVNVYDGKALTDDNLSEIMERTCENVRKVFPMVGARRIKEDVFTIMKTLTQIAYRQNVDTDIGYMTIGEYASSMRAPHRMDLMVSAMAKDGKWNCNQKCVHCYASGQPHSEEPELSTADWKKILDRCRNACIPQVTFTGGEPTMRDDLPELIEYSKWFVTRLNTNGIKLTGDYCMKLKLAQLDSVQITFYSYDEEVHNSLVGTKQYAATVAGIENALKTGLNLSINTPLCTLNRDYVKTLEFLHEKGVMYVTCSGIITTGNAAKEASESLQLTSKELKAVLEDAVDYCAEHGMELSFTSPGWIEESFFASHGLMTPTCGACLSNMAITPSGNVVPCQSWLSGDILGNMLTDDWDSIWNGSVCSKRRDYSALMTGRCPLRR